MCCFTGPLTAGGRPGPFPSSLRCCLAFSYCSSRLCFSPSASTLASRMACLERCCSRATSSSRFSRGMARTFAYPEIITLIDFAIAHNCAPALTGIISRLRTRLRTPISSVAKYSLRVSIAPKKIIKAQWSSVGTVTNNQGSEEERMPLLFPPNFQYMTLRVMALHAHKTWKVICSNCINSLRNRDPSCNNCPFSFYMIADYS